MPETYLDRLTSGKAVVPLVYLSGPMMDCTTTEVTDWRDYVKDALGVRNCLDPARRDYRGRLEEPGIETEIIELDKADISEADILLAYCWKPSYGTAMEIIFAHWIGKPTIVVVPENMTVSPWLRYHARVERSLNEAITIIRTGVPSTSR